MAELSFNNVTDMDLGAASASALANSGGYDLASDQNIFRKESNRDKIFSLLNNVTNGVFNRGIKVNTQVTADQSQMRMLTIFGVLALLVLILNRNKR